MSRTHTLTDSDFSSLSNICQLAAERYEANAKDFRAMIDAPHPRENEMMAVRGDSARRLAEQFERQAQKARDYMEMFSMAEAVTVEVDDSEDDEAA